MIPRLKIAIPIKKRINRRMTAKLSSAHRNPQTELVIMHPPPPPPLLFLLLGQEAFSPFEDTMLEKSLWFQIGSSLRGPPYFHTSRSSRTGKPPKCEK